MLRLNNREAGGKKRPPIQAFVWQAKVLLRRNISLPLDRIVKCSSEWKKSIIAAAISDLGPSWIIVVRRIFRVDPTTEVEKTEGKTETERGKNQPARLKWASPEGRVSLLFLWPYRNRGTSWSNFRLLAVINFCWLRTGETADGVVENRAQRKSSYPSRGWFRRCLEDAWV